MPTTFWLTDEDADISGYKRAKLGSRSTNPSIVRAVTSTVAGPTAPFQITRTAGGATLKWITDPLDGTDLTNAAWESHIWASESNGLANVTVRVQVVRFTNAEGATVLDSNPGTELGTAVADTAYSTATGAVVALAVKERLVIYVYLDDATAGNMATGYTVNVSYNAELANAEGDSYLICPDALALSATIPASTITRVRNYMKDETAALPLVTDAQITQAIAAALPVYSIDRPRRMMRYMSGNGSAVDFPLPAGWVRDFSVIRTIEYPFGEQLRCFIREDEYEVVETVLGVQPQRYLHFMWTTPTSGTDNILVTFTSQHVYNSEVNTVQSNDFEAFIWLCASYACDMMVAHHNEDSQSTFRADHVRSQTTANRWRVLARELKTRYEDFLGQGRAKVSSAEHQANWGVEGSYGQDMLFHRRRMR
jgi:hypothetical protein